MSPVVHTWLGFAALGAALIHLAVGVTAPFPLSVLFLGFGSAELCWGIATLATGRALLPRIVMGAALVPAVSWGLAVLLGSGLGTTITSTGLPLYPLATASLFNLFLFATVALSLRRAPTGLPAAIDTVTPTGWRSLTGLVAGGFLLSALTTPALAATEVGSRAVPHGPHGMSAVTLPDSGPTDGHKSR